MEIPYTAAPRPDTGLYNAKVGIWLFLASEVMLFGALFSSYILLRVGAAPNTWPHGLLNIPIGTFNTAVLITSSITVVMAWASLKMNNFGKFRLYMGLTILCALAFVGIKSVEYKDKFTHYEVHLKDGRKMTGHIEERHITAHEANGKQVPAQTIHGSPWFLNTSKLQNPQAPIEYILFKADAGHGKEGGQKAVHAEEKIESSQIKWLSAYVPAHSTYFAIYFTLTALHALHVIGGMIVMTYMWLPGAFMWKTEPERFTNRIETAGLFWHFVDLVWIFLFPVLYLL